MPEEQSLNQSPQQFINSTPPSDGLPKNKRTLKLNLNIFKESRAYLAEYAVLLIMTGALLGIINSLFSGVISHLGSNLPNPRFGGGFAYTASLYLLASLAVVAPVLFLLTKRTKGSEKTNPSIKNVGWRKAFLGIFLVLVILTAVGYGVALVYELFSRWASIGLPQATKPEVWKPISKHAFGTILFSITAWLYIRDYRATDKATSAGWPMKLHRYGLILASLVLGGLYVTTALKHQRGVFIDNVIVEDLQTISNEVKDYETKYSKLPSNLDTLDLGKDLKARAKAYKYEYTKSSSSYELCAVFSTSTKDKKSSSSDGPLEQYLSGSYRDSSKPSSSYIQEDDDPSVHDKGRQCFTYQANYSSRYNSLLNKYRENYPGAEDVPAQTD